MRYLLSFVTILVWVIGPLAPGETPQQVEAIRALERAGGKVERDASRPGTPVVSIELAGCSVTGDLLRFTRRFDHLACLDL
jgi:hypothetical protein